MAKLTRAAPSAIVLRWASQLRFPWLLLLTGLLFVTNILVPDTLPFVDEILLGLVTLLLAGLRKKPAQSKPAGADPEG